MCYSSAPIVRRFAMVSALLGPCLALQAQDHQATYTINSPQAGMTVAPGATVQWTLAVEVTGTNKGLAIYSVTLQIRSEPAVSPDPAAEAVTMTAPTPVRSFNVAGHAPDGAALNDTWPNGGPNMAMIFSPGIQPGKLVGLGAGFTPPWTYTNESSRMSPGIGRSEYKTVLLKDPNGAYVLQEGSFAAPATPGGYVVAVTPTLTSVLRDIDLERDLSSSGTTSVSTSALTGSQFAFTVAASTGGGGGGTPPSDGGGTTPPDDDGGTTPPDDGGGTTPPPDDNGSGDTGGDTVDSDTDGAGGTGGAPADGNDTQAGEDNNPNPPVASGTCAPGMIETSLACMLGLFVMQRRRS